MEGEPLVEKPRAFFLKDKNLSDCFTSGELSFDFINNLMGPTFPASIFEDKRIGVIKYKGIHFVMKLDPDVDLTSDDKFKNAQLTKV